MKPKIAVCGSASCSDKKILEKSFEIGFEIARQGAIILTGATTGVSLEAAKGAKSKNGFVIGISPAENISEHKNVYHYPTEEFDVLVFTGMGTKGRNAVLVRSSDACVFISGKTGTLNEFTIAFDEGKPIGLLQDSGGIAEKLPEIAKLCRKPNSSKIFENSSPPLIIKQIIANIYKDSQISNR